MDKLERLLNLISALLETSRPLTAEELRERVPGYPESKVAFRRTFERDKDELREMGIPLRFEAVEHGGSVEGYRIDRSQYYLRDPGFEPDELAALHLAATTVQVDGLTGTDGLWKLGGSVEGEGEEPALDGALASLPADPNLPALYQACAQRRRATFTYNDEVRALEPHRVGFQRGRWYVTGFDHTRHDVRNFRLDRIQGTVEVGAPGAFPPPVAAAAPLDTEPWRLGSGDEVVARLLVDGDQAVLAARLLGSNAAAEEREDGAVVFAVPVTNGDAFRSFVLGFLEHAEVLAPPELRDDITTWLAAMAR